MRKVATIILSLGSTIGAIQAETLAVLAGGSIQEKIDLAVDGDIVAIFGGTYNQDLTITKRIRLVEVNGQEVILAGNITFSGIADCPPFGGFTVGSNGNKDIAVNDCTGLVISEIDHTAGRSINVNLNSDIEIKDSTLNSVDIKGEGTVRNITTTGGFSFDGSKIVVTDSTIGGSINHNKGELDISNVTIQGDFDTGNSATKTVAFRTTVTGDCNWRSKLSWFGYGKARGFKFSGSEAKVIFVGSEIDRRNGRDSGLLLNGNNNLYNVVNSHIHNVNSYGDEAIQHNCIEIYGANHVVKIFNNYLSTNHGGSSRVQHTINLSNAVTDAKIIGNIFREDHRERWTKAVYAPFGVLFEGNLWAGISPTGHEFLVAGGVSLGKNNIRAHRDSLFVDGDPYKLAEDSPAINSGTEDPRYNDRDGTRNNIGPSGGSWYDPEGWTTEKPVVISFDLLPDSVLEGVDTEVTIEGVRAVSKP